MEVNRGLPAPYLIKYFDKVGGLWRIKESLRRRVEFRELNLAEDWPGHLQADLILLRNVLIYFEPHTKKEVLARVRRVLRRDGFLLLGAAETTINLDPAFEMVPLDRMMCYQIRGEGGSPPAAAGRPAPESPGTR
jgi:chemotaxis protein methyltransferase CheR